MIPKVERRGDGYRDYPESAAAILRLITGAQDLGFTLAEIRASLLEAGGSLPSKRFMLEALRTKLKGLDANIEQLGRRRALMNATIKELEIECKNTSMAEGLPGRP